MDDGKGTQVANREDTHTSLFEKRWDLLILIAYGSGYKPSEIFLFCWWHFHKPRDVETQTAKALRIDIDKREEVLHDALDHFNRMEELARNRIYTGSKVFKEDMLPDWMEDMLLQLWCYVGGEDDAHIQIPKKRDEKVLFSISQLVKKFCKNSPGVCEIVRFDPNLERHFFS